MSHRFRGRVRRKKCKRQRHQHSGKKIRFGSSSYVLRYALQPTVHLLQIVRKHGPDPLQETSAFVTHLTAYQDMLRKLPRNWMLHPDHEATGSGAARNSCKKASKYVTTWVQRKHVCGQLQLRTGWPPGAEVNVEWLRSWCPDSNCRLGDYEDSMRLDVVEMKAGCPTMS